MGHRFNSWFGNKDPTGVAKRELQLGTTSTPIRMAIVKKFINNKCWRRCWEKGNFLHCYLPRWLSGKESPCNAGDTGDVGSVPQWARSLEKGMATPSSILVWRILWTEELDGLQSMGSQRVGLDWNDLERTHTYTIGGIISWYSHYREQYGELLYDPEIQLVFIY